MAIALNTFYDMKSKDQVEHIEFKERNTAAFARTDTSKDRRQSNRVIPKAIKASLVIKQDFLKIWRRVKNIPCEVNNISFSGLGIRSNDLIRINDVVDIELSSPEGEVRQLVSVRIRNHYRNDDGAYSYGGSL